TSSLYWQNDQRYHDDLFAAFNLAFPNFQQKGILSIPNFNSLAGGSGQWQELDNLATPPFAAMDECNFVCPWGHIEHTTEGSWRSTVEVMASLQHTRVLA